MTTANETNTDDAITIDIEDVSFDEQRIGWEVDYLETDAEGKEENKTGWVEGAYEVCTTCRGKGTHTNKNIDGNGITSSEWAEWDEDERQTYMSGGYDVRCEECEGNKVVAFVVLPDAEAIEKGAKVNPLAQALADHFDGADAARAESDYERRWEAKMLYGSSY